jgi:hypothetical protein
MLFYVDGYLVGGIGGSVKCKWFPSGWDWC